MSMRFKGIIFDFNGTLYADDEVNDLAWSTVIKELANNEQLNVAEFIKDFNTTQDRYYATDILNKLNLPVNEASIKATWTKKEELYVQICKARKMFALAEGVADFLDSLNNVPINIASLAPYINFTFYYEYLNLGKWFDKDKVCYDDGGKFIGKKLMYQQAAKNIGLDIKDCVVFEDSAHSALSAIEAGCQNLIIVNTKRSINFKHPFIIKRIDSFKELTIKDL